MSKLAWIALAGALGTLARYGLAGAVQRVAGAGFPWGTVVVNLTGCFLAGLLWTLFDRRLVLPPETRVAVFVGFMGAYTTFSTYVLETSAFLKSAEWFPAAGNMLVQNLAGIALFFAGAALARLM
jgi:CrcB protein